MKLRSFVTIPGAHLVIAAAIFAILAGGWHLLLPQVVPPQHSSTASLSPVISVPEPSAAADKQVIRTHRVAAGETLSSIAAQYNIDAETLTSANPDVGEIIHPGDELIILPQKGVLHTVDAGDTFWQLANMYGVEAAAIKNANNKQSDHLTIGEKLFIPGGRMRTANPVSRSYAVRFIWPAQGELSSPYGWRWGRLHAGIDIANDVGTPVRAARFGRVSFAGWQGGYGLTVMVEHSQEYTTLYGHLSETAVTVGQYVHTGQVIGYMGNTGNSTGPHLHFEVQTNGRTLNPLGVLP